MGMMHELNQPRRLRQRNLFGLNLHFPVPAPALFNRDHSVEPQLDTDAHRGVKDPYIVHLPVCLISYRPAQVCCL